MITLLEQSKCNKNTFAVTYDSTKATHYEENREIKVFPKNQFINNQPAIKGYEQEPLVMPVMNFGEPKQNNKPIVKSLSYQEPLVMPKMQF
jgi:hypothetical protein